MDLKKAQSRPMATAASLGAFAADAHRFIDKCVLLTGESEVLSTANGRECLESALRLLIRVCPNITVFLPPKIQGQLGAIQQIAREVQFGTPVTFVATEPSLHGFDAILSIGSRLDAGLPWTVINSNGWMARVASSGTGIDADCGQSNPIGALAAASLGVSEVFKRLIVLKTERGPFFPPTTFKLLSYTVGNDDPGPPVPEFTADIALLGCGAIGNGIVHLLSRLLMNGSIDLVDRQVYQDENLGTCFLIGPHAVGHPKSEVMKARFAARSLVVRPHYKSINQYVKGLEASHAYPRIILNALDDIDARHEAQDLWPDLIIDGAIGATQCQVSCNPWGFDVACLRCIFKHPTMSAEKRQQQATGLTTGRLNQPDSLIEQADVDAAAPERKDFLQRNIGKTVCSTVQAAIAQEMSAEKLKEGFEPSAPFVATMSAAMVVTELVRYLAEWPTVLRPRFQFDLLVGPSAGQDVSETRHRDCTCVTRARNIERIRQRRVDSTLVI